VSAKDIHSILRRPIVTEKTTIQKEDHNQVVFMVRRDANKVEIRDAVETLLGVGVTGVRTAVVRGKTKRLGRSIGRRPNWKKAVVTLAPGDDVEFFESLDDLEDFEDFEGEE
jgi:large subunit ribosomal protein L23